MRYYEHMGHYERYYGHMDIWGIIDQMTLTVSTCRYDIQYVQYVHNMTIYGTL